MQTSSKELSTSISDRGVFPAVKRDNSYRGYYGPLPWASYCLKEASLLVSPNVESFYKSFLHAVLTLYASDVSLRERIIFCVALIKSLWEEFCF